MSLLAAVGLATLVLEDDDLLAQALLDDLGLDPHPRDQWPPHGDVAAIVGDEQWLEAELVPGGSRELFHAQGFPLGHAVLFASGLDHGVHELCSSSEPANLEDGGRVSRALCAQRTAALATAPAPRPRSAGEGVGVRVAVRRRNFDPHPIPLPLCGPSLTR